VPDVEAKVVVDGGEDGELCVPLVVVELTANKKPNIHSIQVKTAQKAHTQK